MTARRDTDDLIRSYLEDGPSEMREQSLDAVRAVIDPKRQRAVIGPWRFPDMNNYARYGIAAAAVVLVAVLVVNLMPRFGGGVGGPGASATVPSPTVSPSPAPTESGTATPTGTATITPSATATRAVSPGPTAIDTPGILGVLPDGWTGYHSSQYEFSAGHPRDWTVDPADRAWDFDTDAADHLSSATDDFRSPAGDVRVSLWSVPSNLSDLPDEQMLLGLEDWIEAYCLKTGPSCPPGILDWTAPLCIETRDCHPGLLVFAPDREVQAFFTGGIYPDQLVVATVWRADDDPSVAPYGGARALLEDFLLTMCVVPEETQSTAPFC